MKIEYDAVDIEIFEMTPTGRAYLEYNEKVGGEPFNDCCIGMPDFHVDRDYGGIVGLYHECIKQGKTWQELLGVSGKWDELEDVL